MADILSADQLAEAAQRNLRHQVGRLAILDNDSITAAIISDRVASWGRIKYEVYNKHPAARGNLWFPVCSVKLKNHDKAFDRGGVYFPNGTDDFLSTTLRIVINVGFPSGTETVLDFTGRVREPEYDPTGFVTLVAEHELTALGQRKWVREDRIGGDTGVDAFFTG